VGTVTGNLAGLAGGMQYCRGSRNLLVDSVWGNQGELQTYSKSQKMAKMASTFPALMLSHFICQNASSLSASGMGFTLW
jgi:hypothetical protein